MKTATSFSTQTDWSGYRVRLGGNRLFFRKNTAKNSFETALLNISDHFFNMERLF